METFALPRPVEKALAMCVLIVLIAEHYINLLFQGDSGGPLTYVTNDGVHNQVGIVSFGPSAGCELGFPAGCSRVSYFANWISEVTGLII